MGLEVLAGIAAGIVLVVGGGLFFLRDRRGSKVTPDVTVMEIPEHMKLVADGKKHLRKIVELSTQIKDGSVAVLVTELGLVGQKIYDNLVLDPRDVTVVRNFVDYHAPQCVKLIEEYMRVANLQPSDTRDRALAASLKTLHETKDTFEAFYTKCLENDVEGLAVLSETMRRIGQMERPVVSG
ncbi:MAG: 5-bromo-4-chloroindolyl phosphate hydrolysis family protein [Parcubacteria group bacterium]|nr:5-bromo-4-chloroindolyl phosphate hydrolysis family protein [Parcubacteria group bacterium]